MSPDQIKIIRYHAVIGLLQIRLKQVLTYQRTISRRYKGIKRGDKNQNVGNITGTTKPGEAGGATVKTDAEKQKINEDRINETKNRYYKLMGIDKMNKDAVMTH